MRGYGFSGPPIGRLPVLLAAVGMLLAFGAASAAAPGGEAPPGGATVKMTGVFVPPAVRVGGTVQLQLGFELPAGARLADPPAIEGLDGLTALSVEPGQEGLTAALRVERLESWTGRVRLALELPDGSHAKLESGPLELAVRSNFDRPEDADQAPTIEGIVPVDAFGMGGPLAVLAVAAVLLAAGGLWWWRRRGLARRPPAPSEPPHLRARRDLLALRDRQLAEAGRVKAHYFAFSAILRRYVEALRGFPAAESTTEEIARRLTGEVDRRLLPLLRRADRVKFADRRPDAGLRADDLQAALDYIAATEPTTAPDTADPAAPVAAVPAARQVAP